MLGVLELIGQTLGVFQVESEKSAKTDELEEAKQYFELAVEGTGLGI